MTMTEDQATATANALLGIATPSNANMTKQASAETPELPTSDELYYALGREYASEIVKQAAEDVALSKVEDGLEKVATACVQDAIKDGRIAGYIKMAAGDDPALAQALMQAVQED